MRARGWITIAAALLVGLPTSSWGQGIVAVDRDEVNIRADATVQSSRLAVLHRGDEVEELQRHNEWVQVRLADGRRGWVHSQLVQPRLIVVGQGVRVRAAASSQSVSLTMLYRGQEIGQIGVRGNWMEVRLSDGRTGWAYSQYLRPKTVADARAAGTMAPPDAPVAEPEAPAAPAAAVAPPQPVASGVSEGAANEVTEDDYALVQRNPYAAGLQHEAAGEADLALERFEAVLATDPDNVNALYHAAKAHHKLEQLDQALGRLYRAVEISGGRKDLYLALGEVYRVRGEADSVARYRALLRGERVPQPAATEPAEEEEGGTLPVGKLALAAVLLLVLFGLGVWWVRRKPAATGPAGPDRGRRRSGSGRFERALDREGQSTEEGRATPEEERELDRQIEDRWRELRQSADLFGAASDTASAEGEEENLNQLLDQVEALRRGLDLQDERARIYAEIVRLQNRKIESMREELRLRGRKR